MPGSGCLRPLLVSGGIVAVFLAGAALHNRETLRAMWRNASVMNEGAGWVDRLKTPENLFLAIRSGALRGSAVVVDGGGEPQLDLHADSLRRVFGITRLDVLAGISRLRDRGCVDVGERVAVSELETLSLPLPGAPPWHGPRHRPDSITVEEIVDRMMGERDPVCQDWLILRIEAETTRSGPCQVPNSELPRPFLAVLLAMLESETGAGAASAGMDPVERFRTDPDWRQNRRALLQASRNRFGIREQKALAARHFDSGSARAYATHLLALLDSTETVPWVPPDRLHPGITVSVGGAFPGVISLSAGMAASDGRPSRAAVLLLEDLPGAVFYHLVRRGMDRALLVALLSQPERFSEWESHEAAPGSFR